MVETRTFQPPSTTEVLPLVPERTNIFPVQTIGSLILSEEAITCTGQQLRINNLVISDILEISEFHVLITQVNLLIKDEKVEVDSDHLALPCKTNEEACLTGTGTYIWSQEPTSCQLERVREFQPVRSGSVFLDHQAKIVLNATDRVYLPACRNQEILATNLDGVFLIKNIGNMQWLHPLNPRNFRIDIELTNIQSYLKYSAELNDQQTRLEWTNNICQQRYFTDSDNPIHLHGNTYGLTRGQTLYVFECVDKTDVIAEADKCFRDIPLQTNPPSWVDPRTLLKKTFSPTIPCDAKFPLKIRTTDKWITLNPHISLAAPPLPGTPEMSPIAPPHGEITTHGFYTSSEQLAWEALLTFPQYHQATLQDLALGSCISSDNCGISPTSLTGTVPNYDLSKLLPEPTSWNPLSFISDWVLQHGAWLAFLVIIITICQWLTNVAVLCQNFCRLILINNMCFILFYPLCANA